MTALAVSEPSVVEWTGSRLAAPGPGRFMRLYGSFEPAWRLLGEVLRVSPADPDSIKVRWENGRVTIERKANLTPRRPIGLA